MNEEDAAAADLRCCFWYEEEHVLTCVACVLYEDDEHADWRCLYVVSCMSDEHADLRC